MTTLLLVRHAAHGLLGHVLAGRTPGLGLSEAGQAQAKALVPRLQAWPLSAIYSSPQPRALQTAAPLAEARGLAVEADAAFDEVDFGAWTGRNLTELRADGALWDRWIEQRSSACPPGGEPFTAVHARAAAGVHRLCLAYPEQTVAVVSHGDVIKAVLAGFLGLSLDGVDRFDIGTASLSIVETGPGWAQVKRING